MRTFRIGSALFPHFDGSGAFQYGARWNSPGRRVIYCAGSLACCRLEMLVHIGRMAGRPTNHAWIEIDVPDDLYARAETITRPPIGWDHPTKLDIAQTVGDAWFDAKSSAILRVSSVASKGDRVILLNSTHPDFAKITASPPQPLHWDERLFRQSAPPRL